MTEAFDPLAALAKRAAASIDGTGRGSLSSTNAQPLHVSAEERKAQSSPKPSA